MLVVFLGILGLLANQVVGLPTQAGGHLRSTDNPPQEELGYWCTYMESCKFCWECAHGICKNRVNNSMPLIIENSYLTTCEVSRWYNQCTYGEGNGHYHVMDCSDPVPHNRPHQLLIKIYEKDDL
ncbi:MGF 110-3L [African swine fever virus]|uniref:MGF 110-3L CDS protein n=1 Tax=African swine fever virus TaxID=10497 RepID=A0A6V6ZE08_ASF|nr:MGF 110-4L [African swine fever virus]WEG41875.1 MGF 110-3L [African swine fever virus]WEG42514.1 MGF 110-3L [African swine fever virus]CAD0059434.1 MGF 110-3L CDS [African swine fever virus]CAD0059435.1 MGF 110-4L CDS [African swine fever virus]